METTYREWEKKRRAQTGGRRTASRRRSGEKKAVLGPREARRLGQLAVCVLLFLVVFVGKGIFPEEMEATRDRLTQVLQTDTDFRGAFASLGRSISQGEPVVDTLNNLWVGVFGGSPVTVPETELPHTAFYEAQCAFLSGSAQRDTPTAHWLGAAAGAAAEEPEQLIHPSPLPKPEPEPTVIHVEYSGPALPENASMDRYNLSALGVTETATPALGWVSSGFGWREHPVDGGEKFHNGVDLGVNLGTPVGAFADGTVDYIGESPVYGLYLQIRHTGDLTSFYAHCDKLLVQQGQTVRAGETVALSGDTGNATGPHLHFELKLNGVLINPAYYIETT